MRDDLQQRLQGIASFLIQLLTHDWRYKLMALAMAVGMWAWIQGQEVIMDSVRVQLRYTLPEGLVLNERSPQTTRMDVAGPQGVIKRLLRTPHILPVDLREVEPGLVTVDLDPKAIEGIPEEIQRRALTPNSLQLEIERLMVRQVPLTILSSGQPAEGYRLVSLEAQPPWVTIQGPESAVQVVETLQLAGVDLQGMEESQELEAQLTLAKGVQRLDETTLLVKAEIEPILESRVFERVPVLVRSRGWHSETEHLRVTLEGPSERIRDLSEESVIALVILPEGVSTEEDQMVRSDPEAESRFEIQHGGGERITLKRVEPNQLLVHPPPQRLQARPPLPAEEPPAP